MTTSFEQTSFFYLALLFSTSFYFIFSQRGEDDGRLVSLDERTGSRNALAIFQLSKRGTGLNFAPSFFPLYDRIVRLK